MLAIALFFQFQVKQVAFGDKAVKINYLMMQSNQNLRQLSIDPPVSADPTYIFLRAQQKLSDLGISGDFGNATETGLIWNQPHVKLFDVILEMKTVQNTVFYVVKWVNTAILNNCFFDVGDAAISVEAFKAFSVTSSSLVGSYLIHYGAPYKSFKRSNAFFTPNGELVEEPVVYEKACQKCGPGSLGNMCAECMESMVKHTDASCKCQFFNYQFSDYHDTCAGAPELAEVATNETISGLNMSYFFLCASNWAFSVNYSITFDRDMRLQVFRDDACGLSNIRLNGTIETYNPKPNNSAVAGVVFRKTTDMVNVTVLLRVFNEGQKLLALTYFACNATSGITLENIVFSGSLEEMGSDTYISPDFRVAMLFHTLKDIDLTIRGLMIYQGFFVNNNEGRYHAMGIGLAVNCQFDFRHVYIGEKPTVMQNPLLTFDFGAESQLIAFCSDRMSNQMKREVNLYENFQAQLGGQWSQVQCDTQLYGGLFGGLAGSSLLLTKSVVALYFNQWGFSNGQIGLVVVDCNYSVVTVYDTALHLIANTNGFSGAVGRVADARSRLNISASFNFTSETQSSGFIGEMYAGTLSIAVFLNAVFKQQYTGGIAGRFEGGMITLREAFGSVKTAKADSGNEIGIWSAGQFDKQICDTAPCTLDSPETSYINIKDVDGACAPDVKTTEPVGDEYTRYFFECMQNVKLKVLWEGEMGSGQLTIFAQSYDCKLTNVNVTGSVTVTFASYLSFATLEQCYENASYNYIDLKIELIGPRINQAAFLTCFSSMQIINDTIIKGNITSTSTYTGGKIASLIAHQYNPVSISRLQIYGVTLKANSVGHLSLCIGYILYPVNLNDVVIDSYQKKTEFKIFDAPQLLPTDFRCVDQVTDEELKKSLYQQNMLKRDNSPRRSKITATGSVDYLGGLAAEVYDNIYAQNISISVDVYADKGTDRTALIYGHVRYPVAMNRTYFEGTAFNEYGSILGDVTKQLSLTIAVKVTMQGAKSAFISKIYGSGSTISMVMDMTLNGQKSAGLVQKDVGWTVGISIVYGTLIINADDCHQVMYDPPKDVLSNFVVTNNATCPAWTQ